MSPVYVEDEVLRVLPHQGEGSEGRPDDDKGGGCDTLRSADRQQ